VLSWRAKEEKVREILGKEFGTCFREKPLTLTTGYQRRFDLVSEDSKVVGEIKTDKYTEKAYENTRLPRAMLACRYLELVDADAKLLVFTNRQLYERFKKDASKLGVKGIQLRILEMS